MIFQKTRFLWEINNTKLKETGWLNVIIFGTGKRYIQNKSRFQYMKIIAFLDNDIKKQGSFLDGIIIDSPINIHKYQFDYVILVGKYYAEMYSQLRSLGVDETKILDKDHKGIYSVIKESTRYDVITSCANLNKKKIAMISHSMSTGGAQIAYLLMAKVLKKNAFDVRIYAESKGAILYDFLKAEIPVTVLDGFALDEREIEYYFSGYDCIIVNTIALYDFVSRISILKIPMMWWLHEEDAGYRAHLGNKDINIKRNVHVYGVGSRAIRTFRKYARGENINDLHYGVQKYQQTGIMKAKKKIIFAMIGAVAYHKGQDILNKAVEKFWDMWRERAEFWIIGAISDELKKQYEKEERIRIFGAVAHKKVLELMEEIDVVICASRYDTMPIVLAEAMMLKKVCITTDVTGTAEYIEPYKNGLICKPDDVQSLSEQIEWVLSNQGQLKAMGEASYKVYETEFSEEVFEKNIVSIIKNILADGGTNENGDSCTILS